MTSKKTPVLSIIEGRGFFFYFEIGELGNWEIELLNFDGFIFILGH